MKKLISSVILFFCSIAMAETTISEKDFRIILPSGWTLFEHSKDEGMWVYQSKSGAERITISIKYFTKEPSFEGIKQAISSYVEIRRSSSSELQKNLEITDNDFKEYPGAITNTFIEKSDSDRKAANKTIATKVGIANFYYESYEISKKFLEKIKNILSTTGFAS